MVFDYTKEPGQRLRERGLNHDGKPLVSIITPYYNAGAFFPQTFRSVMNQSFPWFEWIIVDDGSTDPESIELLREYAGKDDRIKTFRKENGGISSARNLAIKNAGTEIIIPLDADDLIEPTYVEIQYWALYKNPNYDWSYSNSLGFQDLEYLWDEPFDPTLLKTTNFLTYCSAIRKAALEEVGCYDEITKHYYEDWRLWLKLLTAHKKPVRTKNYGFWYRRQDKGVLAIINSDPEIQNKASKLIEEVAATADTTVKAKEYPSSGTPFSYRLPEASCWDRKTFTKHEKTHVLLLLPWMEMGGADRFNLEICAGLDKSRFELGIITTQPGENSWQQRFAEHVTDIFNLPEFLDRENWAEFISYYIRSREVDVVFLSNSYFGYYLLPWLRKEFPDLAIVDYVHSETKYWREGGYARTTAVMGEILEKTYVCSESMRQALIRDYGRAPETVETLYIGVDHEEFNADRVLPNKAKAALGIEDDRPLILFPCRVHAEKRPFLMLEIAKELRKTLPEAAFAVVGDGPQLEELRATVKRAGLHHTVYFAGRQSDMLPWYRDAALTLICSLNEGLALTAYESLSMGVPVITSDVGGQRELIDESVGRVLPLQQGRDELDVREFRPEEIRQYTDAIASLLSDKNGYERMRLSCRRRIEEGISSRIMIRRLETIFTGLVHDRELRERRRELSSLLRQVGHYVDDALADHQRLLAKESEAEEVWQGREWFRKLYEKELEREGPLPSASPADEGEAQRMLAEIYQMRTWRLIQRYRRFMDETWLGKLLSKLRDFFRR